MRRFHNLVRGLLLEDGKVLVAHAKGASNTFLPGGHIEIGESAPAALVRELREEIGYEARVDQFLGCVEHRWDESGDENYEINHVFRMRISGLMSGTEPRSLESHLELFWVAVGDLKARNLQPSPLVSLIANTRFDQVTAWWDSGLSDA